MQRQDELADIVSTTGTAFLGLTVGCARCHNHKFDPISQSDYYSLQAVFAGVQHGERQLNTPATELIQRQVQELTGRIDAGRQQLAQMESLASAVDSAARPGLRPAVNAEHNEEVFAPIERAGCDSRLTRRQAMVSRASTSWKCSRLLRTTKAQSIMWHSPPQALPLRLPAPCRDTRFTSSRIFTTDNTAMRHSWIC